ICAGCRRRVRLCRRPSPTLPRWGVAFHSYLEPMLSTDNPMVRDVLLAVMASMAAMERARVSERTKEGLQRIRAAGERQGRPALPLELQSQIRALAATGASAYRMDRQGAWYRH